MAGHLRNIEIADDGTILGCNMYDSVYKRGSVTGYFTYVPGSLY